MPGTDLPAVTPLEGTTKIDEKMFFEPERLSYESAAQLAREIAERCAARVQGRTVVIAGTDLLRDFANLQACLATLEDLKTTYQAIAASATGAAGRMGARPRASAALAAAAVAAAAAAGAAAPPLAVAAAAVNAALGLASLFRQDTEFSGRKTNVDELAFEIELASRLAQRGAGAVFIPDLLVFTPAAGANSLQARLKDVEQARAAAANIAGPMVAQLVLLEGQLDQAVRAKDQATVDAVTAEVTALRQDLQPVTAPLDRADRRLSDLQTQWAAADAGGLTLLARLLRAEALQTKQALYLHAHVVSSGGHFKTTRSLLRTIFTGDGLSFQGGVVVRWALLEASGAVTMGGILTRSRWGEHLSFLFGETEGEG